MIAQIIEGHFSELINREQELSDTRLAICNSCPLLKKKIYGLVCNSELTLNPETNEVRYDDAPGFYRGCECRLKAKTRVAESKCPALKW